LDFDTIAGFANLRVQFSGTAKKIKTYSGIATGLILWLKHLNQQNTFTSLGTKKLMATAR
jgi:hypothetical protein